MLSDEEKKAIESFKEENNNDLSRFDDFNSYTQFKVKRDKLIIDLIEKQSKEIEELKAISEYREKIIKGLGLKTIPETIKGFKELIENNNKKWENKIKAKVIEVKDRPVKDEFITASQGKLNTVIDMESLLEKE